MSVSDWKCYENTTGSHNKFWDIKRDGKEHTVTFGRIGTSGQTRYKSFDSERGCKSSVTRLINGKIKKGYVAVTKTKATGTVPLPKVAKTVLLKESKEAEEVEEEDDWDIDDKPAKPAKRSKYLVARVEVHVTWHEANSLSNEAAIEMTEDGLAEEVRTDYVDALPSNYWDVMSVKKGTKIDDTFIDTKLRKQVVAVTKLVAALGGETETETASDDKGVTKALDEYDDSGWTLKGDKIWVRAHAYADKIVFNNKEALKKFRFGWRLHPDGKTPQHAWRKRIAKSTLPSLRKKVSAIHSDLRLVEE
jgi:predicted DNA-binding WGR domain protein